MLVVAMIDSFLCSLHRDVRLDELKLAYSLKYSVAQKYLLYIPHHIPMC